MYIFQGTDEYKLQQWKDKQFVFIMKILLLIALAILHCQCQPTTSDNCLTYNNNNSVCSQCFPGFYLQIYFCSPCNPLCNCYNSANFCESCQVISHPSVSNKSHICRLCIQSLENCIECHNEFTCTKCMAGRYVDAETNQCSNMTCQQNCEVCLNITHCELCEAGYFLMSENTNMSGVCWQDICANNCLICASVSSCLNCLDEYFENAGECLPCIDNCTVCTDNSTCQECFPGLYFLNGSCSSTGLPNCIAYSGQVGSPICLTCELGYYIWQGSCNQCSGCRRCTQAFICQTQCQKGYRPFNFACLSSQPIIKFLLLFILSTALFLI